MMNTLTDNHFNKWFTDNNNETKGQLIEIYTTPRDVIRVKLLYLGGVVDISKDMFFETYTEAIDYPPKGAICECTINTANSTFVLYSDGKGSYSTSKSNHGAMYRHSSFDLIKIIK